jgi:hypothetical protein
MANEQVQAGRDVVAVWGNPHLVVIEERMFSQAFRDGSGQPMELRHLSIIKMNLAAPQLEWNELNEIKASILGENIEAVELFPSARREIKGLPERHLWCFPPEVAIPLGFLPQQRTVAGESGSVDGVGPDTSDQSGVREALALHEDDASTEVADEITEEDAAVELAEIRRKMLNGNG